MDKRLILAVAGAGKTTHIVNSLTPEKRSLIITYTKCNYDNLLCKIAKKFNERWPENVTLMRYFPFLYQFCYKPFLADIIRAKGITYNDPPPRIPNTKRAYYISPQGYFYSNRLAYYFEKRDVIEDIKYRITKYFDEFVVDEVQDIAGRDFNFLELLMLMDTDMLFVGDFYQHTFDTSRDQNVNKSLFDDFKKYIKRFESKGISCDNNTLARSRRCGHAVCDYITENLGIEIGSNRNTEDDTSVIFVSGLDEAKQILEDDKIIKLHYWKSRRYGADHRNWGETKGEDKYQDVCVLLNKKTMEEYHAGQLSKLAPSTRNRLYVAITRARGNVYLIDESMCKVLM